MTIDDERLIRAACTTGTITVYQAYGPEIAPAMAAGTFVPPFSRDRMTWIKPSFGWMMHRSGWGGDHQVPGPGGHEMTAGCALVCGRALRAVRPACINASRL